MPFRVLVIGPHHFSDDTRLRNVLDAVLANRMPDVELLTTSGSGLLSLIASYAGAHELALRTLPSDLQYPGDPGTQQVSEMVASADAAVVFIDQFSIELKVLLAQIQSRCIPVRVIEISQETGFHRQTKRPGWDSSEPME